MKSNRIISLRVIGGFLLGEAGQVVVMESDGDHGAMTTCGDVDDCRDHIITLLEGGDEAFRRRGKRYKFPHK